MKTAIIGAGISGLYLAKKLAGQGKKVVVFEKRESAAKKACSGLFSSRILELIPESEALIQNKIKKALIHFPKKTVELSFKRHFLAMDRKELDLLVYKQALKAGAEIIFNKEEKASSCLKKGFAKIIAADGALSQTRKELGLKEPRMRLGIQGFTNEKNQSDFVETWPIKDNGFIWKIPKGKKTEWGILLKPILAKRIFDGFLNQRKIKLKKTESALVPEGLTVSKSEKIALIGDSAGLTKPWSGGGVVWSLLAANMLLETFPDFLAYQKRLIAFFRPRIFASRILTELVYFSGFNFPWAIPKKTAIESDFLL